MIFDYTELFLSNGMLGGTSTYFENQMKFNDDRIYFSSVGILMSIHKNGSDLKTISSSNNGENINGIVIKD